jgi:putative oxidoreductase
MALNIGLLIVRVIAGLTLAGHGVQKLFGWFGGGGLRGTAAGFEHLGYRPGLPMALLAGTGESGGGMLLALGLLTPLAAFSGIGVMLNAVVAVHLTKGFWNSNGGFEFPLTIAAAFAGIGFTGPGRYSLDAAFGWHQAGVGWGLAAVAAALVAGFTTILVRSRAIRADRTAS